MYILYCIVLKCHNYFKIKHNNEHVGIPRVVLRHCSTVVSFSFRSAQPRPCVRRAGDPLGPFCEPEQLWRRTCWLYFIGLV